MRNRVDNSAKARQSTAETICIDSREYGFTKLGTTPGGGASPGTDASIVEGSSAILIIVVLLPH